MKVILTAILLCAVLGCPMPSGNGPIPTGTIGDCLKSEDAFYRIRGGFDYSRAPVLYPYHLVNITGTITLCASNDIIVGNALSVGLTKGYIYGSAGPDQEFGKTIPAHWFMVEVSTRKYWTYDTEADYTDALRAKNIDAAGVLPCQKVEESFMKKGVDLFMDHR